MLKKYPEKQAEHLVAVEQVLQLELQLKQDPLLRKYPELQVEQAPVLLLHVLQLAEQQVEFAVRTYGLLQIVQYVDELQI